jgi:hypothetical protein
VKLALLAVALTGCANLLGLDDTRLDKHDAATDGGVCDGAPQCHFTSGRSVCGQIDKAGTAPGPFRVPVPSGRPCTGSPQGPCALTITGDTLANYVAGNTSSRVTGSVDDCGRYAIPDLPASESDVVVIATGIGFVETARLVLGRPGGAGADEGMDAFVITPSAAGSWATQLSPSNPPDVSSGFAVSFLAGTSPVAMEQVDIDGSPAGAPPNPPWAAFYKDTGFETLDPTLTATGADGTAFVVPRNQNSFDLRGTHAGKSCTQTGLNAVPNVLQFLVLTSC